MGIYLVDYENVHNDGVTDIQKLSASDRVVIFYGDSIKSIPFETHVEMMASKAAIEYIETHKVAKKDVYKRQSLLRKYPESMQNSASRSRNAFPR